MNDARTVLNDAALADTCVAALQAEIDAVAAYAARGGADMALAMLSSFCAWLMAV